MKQLKNEFSKLVDSQRADLLNVATDSAELTEVGPDFSSDPNVIPSKVLQGRTRTEYKHKQS